MIEIRTLRDILRLLFIFKRDFAWAWVVTLLVVVIGAFTLPVRFASEARLMVKPGRENLTVPIDATDRQTVVPQSTQRDPIVDEEKILTGRPVLDAASSFYLGKLGLDEPPAGFFKQVKYQLKKGIAAAVDRTREFAVMLGLTEDPGDEARLSRRLAERFDVTHTPGSAVMEVRLTWDDPVVAQRLLEVWLKAYLDERSRILGRGNLIGFYQEKVALATQQVDGYKQALQGRLERIDGISVQERLGALTERLNEMRTRQADALGEMASLKRGIDASTSTIARLPAEVLSEREVGPDTSWLALNSQLAELKRQRVEALRTFTETAPAVQSIDESIAALEKRTRTETRDAPRLERRSSNTVATNLQRGSAEKSVRIEELNALLVSYGKEIKEIETERQRVMSAEPELARIERELVAAEKNHALYIENLEKARIDQALDESRISNVAVVEAPTLNPARVFPQSLTLLLVAFPAACFVGLLVVYIRSLFDQRVHDGSGIEARFGVPVWSTVKAVHAPSDEDSGFDASLYQLYSRLPRERIAAQGLTLALASAQRGEGVHFIARHLQTLLARENIPVVTDLPEGGNVPGQVRLLVAPGLVTSREALAKLSRADLIALVVDARGSTVPMLDHALRTLSAAYGRVDGVVVNRREYEIPGRVLRWLGH